MAFGKIFVRLFLLSFFSLIVSMGAVALACADTITTDTALTEDLLKCPADGITVGADNITLDCQGHKITGASHDRSGVFVNNAQGVTVKNCIVENFNYGINFSTVDYSEIRANVLRNNHSGLYISHSAYNVLSGNVSESNRFGFEMEKTVTNNDVTNNTVQNNLLDGFKLYTRVKNNTFSRNVVAGNSTGFGLRDTETEYNQIFSNYITGNSLYGIAIFANWIVGSNTIYDNYFSDNRVNAHDDSYNTNWNTEKRIGRNIIGGPYIGGNYWSDYAGQDTDGDGIGDTDTPYKSSGTMNSGGDYLPLVKRKVWNSGNPVKITPIRIEPFGG